jgi:translation initiation factor IF-3
MSRAREAGLDLVEVDSNGQPPVCRILDYGKFKYEQAKRERDARKHQRGTMIHEVRLRPRTGQHDIDLKVRIATRLLATGDKVKLSVMFRGREISHPEVGREVLNKAISGLGDAASIEKPPGMEGRFLTVILTPTAKKPAAKDKAKAKPASNAAGDGKKVVKAEKAAEAEAAPAGEDQKTPAKAEVEAKAAPAGGSDAPAKKEAETAATAKKDEA